MVASVNLFPVAQAAKLGGAEYSPLRVVPGSAPAGAGNDAVPWTSWPLALMADGSGLGVDAFSAELGNLY